MSTFTHPMSQTRAADFAEMPAVEARPQEVASPSSLDWDPEAFAQDQIRGLVRQLYSVGSKPSRQVVFSAVDRGTSLSELCQQVAEALSEEARGATCLLDFTTQDRCAAIPEDASFCIRADETPFSHFRDRSLKITGNLWYMTPQVFLGERGNKVSAAWLRSRLAELQLEFDYLVIQAPPAGATNEAALLARMCDGMVLVLQANATRRVSAQRAKERLAAAHVRLLGTVLTERTFPIPQAIYKRT
jgi:hypothetical protein